MRARSSAGAASFCIAIGVIDCGGLVVFEELDALVGEAHEDALDLIGCEFDVLQHVCDALGGEIALLAPLGNQFAHLINGWLYRFYRLIGCERIDRRHCLVPPTALASGKTPSMLQPKRWSLRSLDDS